MKIYELNEENVRTQDFGNPPRILDDEILAILQDATMVPNDEDKKAVMDFAIRQVGLSYGALMGFCQGFDLALQYMELVRRRDDSAAFEKTLGL